MLCLVVTSFSCSPQSGSEETHFQSSTDTTNSDKARARVSIGPQFWPYDLSEYQRVDSDVLYGMGGRWISIRYQRKDSSAINRDEMVKRISKTLKNEGWSSKTLEIVSLYRTEGDKKMSENRRGLLEGESHSFSISHSQSCFCNSLPGERRYVLSKIWETSPDDLCFCRLAKEDEPRNWIFNQVIHISQNAEILCIYAEVGW